MSLTRVLHKLGLTMSNAAVVAAIVLALLRPSGTFAQSFVVVGFPAGSDGSRFEALSADGHTAVGFTVAGSPQRSMIWRADSGRIDIGPLGGFNNVASAVSANGGFVAGAAQSSSSGPYRAYRWTESSGFQSIGVQPGYTESSASGVSGDGSVIIGRSSVSQQGAEVAAQAFRWTASGGMQPLGFTRPGSGYSSASGISRDGSVIVGTSRTGLQYDAFRWTATGGMTVLTPLPGSTQNFAGSVDPTATLITGSCGLRAVLWRNGIPQDLGLAPGYQRSSGGLMSDDASVIVTAMQSNSGGILSAGVWTEQTGMILLEDYLRARGTPIPPTFRLDNVTGISADGQTFAGYSVSGQFVYGWVATVPTPASALLLIGLLAPRRRPR